MRKRVIEEDLESGSVGNFSDRRCVEHLGIQS